MRAAIDSRQELDVLRNDKDKQPGAEEKAPEKPKAPVVKKDPLTQDAQLSAALLMLRLQLAGAQI